MNRVKKSRNKKSLSTYRLGNRKVNVMKEGENETMKEKEFNEQSNEFTDNLANKKSTESKRKHESSSSDNDDSNYDANEEDYFKSCINASFNYRKLNKEKKIELLSKIYSKKDDNKSIDEERDVQLEQKITNETIKLRTLKNEEDIRIQNEKILILKEKLYLSNYAKNLIKTGIFDKEEDKKQRTIKTMPFRDVNHMTSSKLICFIYIAMRLLNYDIYLFDLIRWIEFTNIPYFNLNHLLPDHWYFIENDHFLFIKTKTPQLFNLNNSITALVNYLEIPRFPLPDIKKLIVRIVDDLNLPDSLAKFTCNIFDKQLQSNARTKEFFNKPTDKNWFTVPEYELVAFGLVFLSLKHLFCLNDYNEILLSKKLKESSNKFNWIEWEEHTKFKLECFKAYIYPFRSNKKSLDNNNHSMLINYYGKQLDNPKREIFEPPKLYYSLKASKEIVKEVPKLFEDLIVNENNQNEEDNSNESIEIRPTCYPFKAFKEYINQNFKTRNDKLLNKEFKEKTIGYLFKNDCNKINIENPVLFRAKSKIDLDKNNRKIKFLISLSTYYLNTYDISFVSTIAAIENCFFPSYYEIIENDLESKKQNNPDLENARMFIDSFAFVAGVEEEDRLRIKNKELKVLNI